MQRVSRSSAVPSLPAAPASPGAPGYFTGGNPALGQGATVPGYEWFNAVQEELMAVIARGGITPDANDLSQLSKSMDKQYGGGYRALIANATLTADDAGIVVINASVSSLVVTLPLVSSFPNRALRFLLFRTDNTANTVTIQRSGSDTIEGQTSIMLAPMGAGWNSNIELCSDGMGSWITPRPLPANNSRNGIARFATTAETNVGVVADAVITPAGLAGAMGKLLAANGYQRLPGGLIIQWGATNFSDIGGGGVNVSATFPIAFPGAVLNVLGSEGSTANGNFSIITASWTLTGVTFTLTEWSAVVQNAQVRYLAIGY